jgi:hypothetical protein
MVDVDSPELMRWGSGLKGTLPGMAPKEEEDPSKSLLYGDMGVSSFMCFKPLASDGIDL